VLLKRENIKHKNEIIERISGVHMILNVGDFNGLGFISNLFPKLSLIESVSS